MRRWVDSFPSQVLVMRPVVVLLLLLFSLLGGCLSADDIETVETGDVLFEIAIENGDL